MSNFKDLGSNSNRDFKENHIKSNFMEDNDSNKNKNFMETYKPSNFTEGYKSSNFKETYKQSNFLDRSSVSDSSSNAFYPARAPMPSNQYTGISNQNFGVSNDIIRISTDNIKISTSNFVNLNEKFKSSSDILVYLRQHPEFERLGLTGGNTIAAIISAILSGTLLLGGVALVVVSGGTALTPLTSLGVTLMIGTGLNGTINAVKGILENNFSLGNFLIGSLGSACLTLLTFGAGALAGNLVGLAVCGKNLTEATVKTIAYMAGGIAGCSVRSGVYVIRTSLHGKTVQLIELIIQGVSGFAEGGIAGYLVVNAKLINGDFQLGETVKLKEKTVAGSSEVTSFESLKKNPEFASETTKASCKRTGPFDVFREFGFSDDLLKPFQIDINKMAKEFYFLLEKAYLELNLNIPQTLEVVNKGVVYITYKAGFVTVNALGGYCVYNGVLYGKPDSSSAKEDDTEKNRLRDEQSQFQQLKKVSRTQTKCDESREKCICDQINLKVFYLNARSINPTNRNRTFQQKIEEIKRQINQYQPEIIAIVESWLKEKHEDDEIVTLLGLKGYRIFRQDRGSENLDNAYVIGDDENKDLGRRGGGILVAYRCSSQRIQFERNRAEDFNDNIMNFDILYTCSCAKCNEFDKRKMFGLTVVYRRPGPFKDQDQGSFQKTNDRIMDRLAHIGYVYDDFMLNYKGAAMLGDFNLFLNHDSLEAIRVNMDLLRTNETHKLGGVLDQVYSYRGFVKNNQVSVSQTISDHSALMFELNLGNDSPEGSHCDAKKCANK